MIRFSKVDNNSVEISLKKSLRQRLTRRFIGIAICFASIWHAIEAWGHPFQPNKVSAINEFYEFTLLGIEHILTGYDHLLFLLGLHIVDRKLMHIVKVVTAFTVAHSLTLGLAALDIVTLPVRPIEALIALSIVYIAVENLILKKRPEKRWIVAFGFGLVHGFGFAGILRDIGLAETKLLISLFSFNIGVEIGQIGVVMLLFPLLVGIGRMRWRGNTQAKTLTFQRAVSVCILIFGAIWFVERAFISTPEPTETQQGWTVTRKAELDANFEAVRFSGPQCGWAVGSEGTIAHTSDSGETWEIQKPPTNRYLFGADFINEQEGWVVGEDGVILHTQDGGVNWHAQSSGTDAPFMAIDFIDANNGWVVGMEGWIMHTADGGKTWERQQSGTYNELSTVHFIDRKRGWTTGTYGTVLHTGDGGKTWHAGKVPTGYETIGASFTSDQTGWAVTTIGAVFDTDNSGMTWKKRHGGQNLNILGAISFISETEGWSAG